MILKKIFSLILIMVSILFMTGNTVMAKEILNKKQQNIAMIASFTATGDLDNLETAIEKGLNDGLTINEIKEELIQMYAYCGFPRSLNALGTLMKVSENGNYKTGKEGTPLAKNSDKNAIGEKTQTMLTGAPVKGKLFDFAPAIDDYLKEHLFGDIFARGVLTNEEREIATIAALSSIEGVEPQLNAHIKIGLNIGIKQEQIDEILKLTSRPKTNVFAIGNKNEAYAKYFKGQSYLNLLTKEQVVTANVTFEPKCRNNWHIHHKGGQILLVTAGRGYYQEWGKPAQELKKGDFVNIPPEIKHWHGAAKDSWFSHIAIEVPSDGGSTEWLEAVTDEEYNKLR